jgi:hypothetical protein
MNTLKRLFVVVFLGGTFAFTQTGEIVDAPWPNSAGVLLASNAASSDPIAPADGSLMIRPAMVVPTPLKPSVATRGKRVFYGFMAAEHGAALLDAWSTRDVLRAGGRELDPMVRPFAHSPTLYPALQVAPFAVDYFAARLMRSNHRFLRSMWWVPQLVSTAGSAYCGINNLGNRP